jgi:hypothetical protein
METTSIHSQWSRKTTLAIEVYTPQQPREILLEVEGIYFQWLRETTLAFEVYIPQRLRGFLSAI